MNLLVLAFIFIEINLTEVTCSNAKRRPLRDGALHTPYLDLDFQKIQVKYSPSNGLVYSSVAVNYVETYVLPIKLSFQFHEIFSYENFYKHAHLIIRLKKPDVPNPHQQCGSKTKEQILNILWGRLSEGKSLNYAILKVTFR